MSLIEDNNVEPATPSKVPQIGSILVDKHGLSTEQSSAPYVPPGNDSELDRELVTLFNPNSKKTRNIRALRTRVMLRADHLAIAVTGAVSGEGCSYVAANLAVSFAQMGKKTILVDANHHDPRQHEIFALGRTPGLTELVSPRANSGPHSFHIPGVPALSVMPAGAPSPNADEIMCGTRGARLIELLKSQYEVVIIDTPNGATSSMPEWYANKVGQALLVVRKNKSRWSNSQRLSKRLAEHAEVIGVAMTDHKR